MNDSKENITDDLGKACDVLRQGGLILYPTDTIWGIGCDATNEAAVQRVYALKQREESKALLVLIDSEAKLTGYLSEVPEIAWDLIELSDKPLTIIYPEAKNLAPSLLGVDRSVGIRVTRERFSHQLCERFRRPIVSTSANISGAPSPSLFREISDEIRAGVDYIVNYRQRDESPVQPSGILSIGESGVIKVIRE